MGISDFFEENKKTAVAFSGGVDSSYLLYCAAKYGEDVAAYYVKSEFQPSFEYDDALKMARMLGVSMHVIKTDVLALPEISENGENRCYFCKKRIFSTIVESAEKDGYDVIIDGVNASDEEADRPGMKAARELNVRSPLRECGLTKQQIRAQSKKAGLFTWNKPAYACLATRIKTGEEITAEKLAAVENAEDYLRSLEFADFRVRTSGRKALLQVRERDMPRAIEKSDEIRREFYKYYDSVALDLKPRK